MRKMAAGPIGANEAQSEPGHVCERGDSAKAPFTKGTLRVVLGA